MPRRRIGTTPIMACAATILLLVAARGSPASAQQSDQAAPVNPAQAEDTSPSAGTSAAQDDGLPVLVVTSVAVTHTGGQPTVDLIRVTGLASSGGWSAPRLVPTYEGPAPDGVLDLELVATPPDRTVQAEGFQPMDALLELAADHPYKAVRVRGAQNAVATDRLPGTAEAEIKINDCHDCVGKHFGAEDKPGSVQPGAVTADGLPRVLRLIRPSDGVYGADLDPNRLTLLLDGKDTILKAFWE